MPHQPIIEQLAKQSSAYHHPYVKALSWVIHSPELLKGTYGSKFELVDKALWQELFADSETLLQGLDTEPQPLIEWVDKVRSYLLGLRFETLLHFLLLECQKQGKISHLASNTVLYDEAHRTLGEMDFVFYHPQSQQRFHWETAIKFYLFRPKEFSFERWVGPNGGDWLSRKVEHLFSRQLGISNTMEAKQTFKQLFSETLNESPMVRQALLKGMLFYPLNNETPLNLDEQELISHQHIQGWYCEPEDFYQVDPDQRGRWKIVEKLNWIMPQTFHYHDEKIYTGQEMNILVKNHFQNSRRSIMLTHLLLDEETQLWTEHSRGIIVDKLWPTYKQNISE